MDQENKIIEVTPQVFQKTIPYKSIFLILNNYFLKQITTLYANNYQKVWKEAQIIKCQGICVNYLNSMKLKFYTGIKQIQVQNTELIYIINISSKQGIFLFDKFQKTTNRNVAFNGFKDFLNFEDVDDIALHKRQLLFLTLSGHFTLKSLRGVERIEKIKEFIKEEIFLKLHEFLSPLFEEVVKNISIQKLNLSYIQLLEEKQQEQKDSWIDYNFIVDQIIDMAPAYAKEDVIDVSNINKRQKKLRTKNQTVIQKQEQQVEIKQQPLMKEMSFQEQKGDVQNGQFSNQMLLRSNQFLKFNNSLESIQQPSFNFYGDLNTHSKFNFFSKRSFK